MRFVKKIYTIRFLGQKFVHTKSAKIATIFTHNETAQMHWYQYFKYFFVRNELSVQKFPQFQCKITLVECKSCTSMQILQESAFFSGKIYTAGTNFTRLPVTTNLTSICLVNCKSKSMVQLVATGPLRLIKLASDWQNVSNAPDPKRINWPSHTLAGYAAYCMQGHVTRQEGLKSQKFLI